MGGLTLVACLTFEGEQGDRVRLEKDGSTYYADKDVPGPGWRGVIRAGASLEPGIRKGGYVIVEEIEWTD